MPGRPRLERGIVKHDVMWILAQGELTQDEIAERYGVNQPAVSEFNRRHAHEILALREHLEDEMRAVRTTDKITRAAYYHSQVELSQHFLDEYEESGGKLTQGVSEMIRTQQAALRALADELGQIPTKVTVASEATVTHIVEGVNLDNLD